MISRILVFLLFYIFCTMQIFAQEMPVPADVQGELISKILMLDNSRHVKRNINIGIIYSESSRISHETFHFVVDKINDFKGSLEIKVYAIEVSELNKLKELVTSMKINSLFITPLRGINHSEISELCEAKKILTFSADPNLIGSYYSIGFELIDSKVKIAINLKSARAEGADLSSRLLKIARIINN